MIPNVPHQYPNLFQAIFVPLCGVLALRALLRTWTCRIPRWSGWLGVCAWSAAAAAIAMPDLTIVAANALGITRGADLVVYMAILGGMGVSFYFYQRARQLENVVTELVRREAIRSATAPSAQRTE